VFAHKSKGMFGSKPEAFKMMYDPRNIKGWWGLTDMIEKPGLRRAYKAGLVGPAVVGGAAGVAAGARLARPKKPVKKNLEGDTMISAFGVNHGEEIAKFSIGGGLKAMKFGNASSVPKAMAVGWKRGGQQAATGNMGAVRGFGQKAGRALQYGAKRSPGTAITAGTVATGAVAAPAFKKN
jgi:hypothetical protein